MIDLKAERIKILTEAAAGRRMGLLSYQINIDNFQIAIAKIDASENPEPHMVEFADQLRELLQSNIRERDKEKLLLDVIEEQLAEA